MSNLQMIAVPDIGDFKNVPIVEVKVKPGDLIAIDDTLIVVESDKATLDVPAPSSGRVKEVKVALGDLVSAGTMIVEIEADETTASAPKAVAAPAPPPVTGAAVVEFPTPAQTVPPPAAANSGGPLPHASPSLRKFARELGVDLSQITGSGPKGRIMKEDVQVFVKARMTGASPGAGALNVLPWPQIDFAKFGPIERAPLSKIRKISGANLARNAIVIPHVTNFDEADITDLEAFRVALNEEREKGAAKLTALAFVIKAATATLKKFPAFNASLDGEDVILKRYYNIGFAVDTPDGLVVPNIKDADKKGLLDIAAECARIGGEAREGRLKASDIQGASFTVSSLGGIGGTGFTPIINAPEVAILGLVRAATKPVWDAGTFRPRLIQPVSLSWDHRVVDGVAAARFLGHLCALLGDFRRIAL